MKLTQVRSLLAVVERGNVQAGAEWMGVTPATLIRSIRDLEKELGTVLVERSGGSIVSTPIGRAFASRAAVATRELDRAREEIGRKLRALAGSVSVGVSAAALATLLPRALASFRRDHGDVRLRLVETVLPDADRQVRDGLIDLFVGTGELDGQADDLLVECLGEPDWIVIARDAHPLAGVVSADLAGTRWIATPGAATDSLLADIPDAVVAMSADTAMAAPAPALRT